MKDLQNRCERVVELEISLTEVKEEYDNLVKSQTSRIQQQKMTFLERNLEQLTSVQKQLVEQNYHLKKDLAVAERKLQARNERILSLENLLGEAQKKIDQQNVKFETQLGQLREKLQDSRGTGYNEKWSWMYLNNQVVSSSAATSPTTLVMSSRVAKPIRGGGGGGNGNGNGNGNGGIVELREDQLKGNAAGWYASPNLSKP